MTRIGFNWAIALCAVAGPVALGPLLAQPAAPAASETAVAPPRPPAPKPPTELFRRLLAASPAERASLLAGKPAHSLLVISNALREYAALPPGAREVRLRTLELGWYLDPLLRLTPTHRADRLAGVPDPWRRQIEDRLKIWDKLPENLRREVLANRSAVKVILTTPSLPPYPPSATAHSSHTGLPPVPNVINAQRQRLQTSLMILFDLDEMEKTKILAGFSEVQQAEMKKAIDAFESLPQPQRDLCITGLTKFATLTPGQRQQFLKNCEVWTSLSPGEQAALRRLAAIRLSAPPLPPGARLQSAQTGSAATTPIQTPK